MKGFVVYSGGRRVSGEVLLNHDVTEAVGVFESLRTYGGHIFQEGEHLKRLEESAKTVGYTWPVSHAQVHRELSTALKTFYAENPGAKDVFLRLTLWQGRIVVMIGQRKHPSKIYRRGVQLRTSVVRRSMPRSWPGEVKTSAYQPGVMASLGAAHSRPYEWILLDAAGYVSETRIGNIFIVEREKKRRRSSPVLITPPADDILRGVTRGFVIECAQKAGMTVHETRLTRHQLYTAEEVFLTNTSWEILPVREIDGRRIGQRVPGKVTAKLHTLFKERIRHQWT